jgi:hypothetical protein
MARFKYSVYLYRELFAAILASAKAGALSFYLVMLPHTTAFRAGATVSPYDAFEINNGGFFVVKVGSGKNRHNNLM